MKNIRGAVKAASAAAGTPQATGGPPFLQP
jgi:hypothetical protein